MPESQKQDACCISAAILFQSKGPAILKAQLLIEASQGSVILETANCAPLDDLSDQAGM